VRRDEKVALVEKMQESFNAAPHFLLANFNGLTVNQATQLRRQIRKAGGRYAVIKNRLAKRAAAGTPLEPLTAKLSGPCALASHDSDPVALAKALSEFVKENPQVELLAGLIDAKEIVDAAGVKQLSLLPGMPELRAQLLCLIQTPATTLVRLLNTPAEQLARVVDVHGETQGGGGTAEG